IHRLPAAECVAVLIKFHCCRHAPSGRGERRSGRPTGAEVNMPSGSEKRRMSAIDVSVITPTHHREELVVQAVKSVLAQRGVSVECIVLDDAPDASARDAIATIGDERVRYIARNEPSGGRPALVRNQGAALAQG